MTSSEALLRASIANPNVTAITPEKRLSALTPCFDVFRLTLPLPDFNGLPTNWIFAIQRPRDGSAHCATREAVLDSAYSVLGGIPESEHVVLVSNDPAARLGDEFDRARRAVFCLDSLEFVDHGKKSLPPRLAPFLGAVRRRVTTDPVFALLHSPYQRSKPVWGWRFFGRGDQLEQLVLTNENFVIVGPRRIGKTSLMREAHRRLVERGEEAYFVDVQDCTSANDVVREIVHQISPRELARSVKHHEVLGDTVLASTLRRMASGSARTTLFLDELGNVIHGLPKDNWSFLGVLRKFSQAGQLRFVVSCFQEYFLRQQQEFSGPLINFATTMRLRVFNPKEAESFVLAPLQFWTNLNEREERGIVDIVTSRVGRHPFLLQYFCAELFQRLAGGDTTANVVRSLGRPEFVQEINALISSRLIECFGPAVDELFGKIPSPLVKYLFVKKCRDALKLGERLHQVYFDYDWVQQCLRELGYEGTFQSYSNVLEALEMYSLCTGASDTNNKMMLTAPIVYAYLEKSIGPLDGMITRLADDVQRRPPEYELQRLRA
jgi:hypothetical protein